MGRYKCRVKLNRDSGSPNKRDTPVKPALSRRDKCRRLLPIRRHEAITEEPVMEEMNVPTVRPIYPVLTSMKPVHCESTLHLSSPAFTENPRCTAIQPAAPAQKKHGYQVSATGHPTIQMTPDPRVLKCVATPVQEILAVTPESITSSSMESGTTFSSDDDDDEEDCFSSASSSSSSLPSPEIFRKDSYVEALTFPMKEALLGLHLHIKNSTLLDVSHAESIHMHHSPNLSTIIDASSILAEKKSEINLPRGPEAETKQHTDSFKSDEAFKSKTPPKLTNRRPISYKKKVWFKSPIISETFETKHIPATKLTAQHTTEPIQTSSPTEQIKPDADPSSPGEISSKEEALPLMVSLKRPLKSSPEKVKFFDFCNNSDRNMFFQGMRERSVRLRSVPLFPLTAAKHTNSLIL